MPQVPGSARRSAEKLTSMSFRPWLLKKISPGVSSEVCQVQHRTRRRNPDRCSALNCTLNTDNRSSAK